MTRPALRALAISLAFLTLADAARHLAASSAIIASEVNSNPQARVLIELAVMSKCPDARRAEARFDEVLARVHSIASVRLIYIADEAPGAPGGIACKHGAPECAGDSQQLCAAYYGRHDTPRGSGGDPWGRGWAFLQCQNSDFTAVGSPELADSCLQAANFTEHRAASTRACWSGPEGARLLRGSAAEARRRGVAKSCTVFIGGAYRCTHDDEEWYDCPGGSEVEDFVTSVCDQYRQLSGGQWPEEACGPEPGPLAGGGEQEGAAAEAGVEVAVATDEVLEENSGEGFADELVEEAVEAVEIEEAVEAVAELQMEANVLQLEADREGQGEVEGEVSTT